HTTLNRQFMTLSSIFEKVRNRERISREEGLALLQETELLDLGDLANEVRFRKNPPGSSDKPYVTFVVDTNPNYTNICNVDCIFCAFYRHPGDSGEYTYSVDQMIQKFKEAARQRVTTVLLQVEVHPEI